jgi:adenosylhomocysteine nucleosidase
MIGIMSAMQEEIHTLLDAIKDKRSTRKGKRTYYTGKLNGKEVVLVFSRWGKVASATTATQMINDFDPEEIIFTGVGGSVSKDLYIGDIVIGKDLYQHDMDTSPLLPLFEIPLLNKTSFSTSDMHRIKMQRAVEDFLKEYDSHISVAERQKFSMERPKMRIADIASGDQFISKKEQIGFLREYLPSVQCVEMEGAAVAQVCYEYNIPFTVIRTISDDAGDNSHIEFQLFAKEIASIYALGILNNYLQP